MKYGSESPLPDGGRYDSRAVRRWSEDPCRPAGRPSTTTSRTWCPAGPRGPGGRRGAGRLDWGGCRGPRAGTDRSRPRSSPRSWPGGTHRVGPLRGPSGRAGRVRLRPHLLRTQVGERAAPAGAPGAGAAGGAAHAAAVAEALGVPGAGRASACAAVRSGEVGRTWPPPGRWPVSSSTGPAGPSIPTSTPTWWRPTWPRGSTGAGRRVDSRRLYAHLRRAQAVYHARLRLELGGAAGRGVGGPSRPGWVTWSASTRCCAGSSRSGRPRWTSTATDGRDRRDRSAGPCRLPCRPSGQGPHGHRRALRAEWRRRAARFGFDLGDLSSVVGPGAEPRGRRSRRPADGLGLEGLARHRRSCPTVTWWRWWRGLALGGASAAAIESAAGHLADTCERRPADGRSAGRSGSRGRRDPAAARVPDGRRFRVHG